MKAEQEEAIAKFIKELKHSADYWEKTNGDSKSKLDGLLFSILVLLDGGSGDYNGFSLKERVFDDELEKQIGLGEEISVGYLHEIMSKYTNCR